MSAASHSEYCALLRSAVQKLGKAPADEEQVRLVELVLRVHDRLARPPRILLLGEVNSGKSSLANLLIGESVVPTSVIANSRFPIRFHHSSKPTLSALLKGGSRQTFVWSQIHSVAELPVERVEVGLPVERLRTFEVIDMPGTGNPAQDVRRFERQLALAHLPIWCTVATRAWRESERREWLRLADTRKARGLLVVTQADLLAERTDLAKVLDRLDSETAGLFRMIVPVALPDALSSSVISGTPQTQDLWVKSGGAQLERAISNLLSEIAEHRVTSAKQALCNAFLRRGLFAGQNDRTHPGADVFHTLIPSHISAAARIPPLLGSPGQPSSSGSRSGEARL